MFIEKNFRNRTGPLSGKRFPDGFCPIIVRTATRQNRLTQGLKAGFLAYHPHKTKGLRPGVRFFSFACRSGWESENQTFHRLPPAISIRNAYKIIRVAKLEALFCPACKKRNGATQQGREFAKQARPVILEGLPFPRGPENFFFVGRSFQFLVKRYFHRRKGF